MADSPTTPLKELLFAWKAREASLLGDALGDMHMAYDRASQDDWVSAGTYLRLALDQMIDAGVIEREKNDV